MSDEAAAPRVFISHSAADKARFVIPFATSLRTSGINAWVDKWEMLPGDSLVSKIFDDGIKKCSAFIVVLSENSVKSKWVQEELSNAVVKAIEDKTRLIPVRLDGCEVPQVLMHRLWVEVPNPESYDEQLREIVRAIFEQHEKPPVGSRPRYSLPDVLVFDGLNKIDSLVLTWACRVSIEQEFSIVSPAGKLEPAMAEHDISTEEVTESLAVLHENGHIELFNRAALAGTAAPFKVTHLGFETFIRSESGYNESFNQISLYLVRLERTNTQQIVDALKLPKRIVNHVLETLQSYGLIGMTDVAGGNYLVLSVSPQLRRKLRDEA